MCYLSFPKRSCFLARSLRVMNLWYSKLAKMSSENCRKIAYDLHFRRINHTKRRFLHLCYSTMHKYSCRSFWENAFIKYERKPDKRNEFGKNLQKHLDKRHFWWYNPKCGNKSAQKRPLPRNKTEKAWMFFDSFLQKPAFFSQQRKVNDYESSDRLFRRKRI